MVKKSTIIALTAVIISLCFITSGIIISKVPNVKVISVDPQKVDTTVICTGRMEYSDNQILCANQLAVVEEVFVTEGDIIKKGDKLYSYIPQNTSTLGSQVDEAAKMTEDEIIKSVLSGDISSLDSYEKDGIAVSTKVDNGAEPILVCSDYDGAVGEVNIKKGNLISPGDELITFAESNSMQARLSVSENKISEIKVGQKAKLTCNAVKNNIMNGTVFKIGNSAKQTTTSTGKETTIDVIVKIDSGLTDVVKSGYSVKCTITVGSKDNAVILPYESIKYDDSGEEYVLCYSQAGICEKRSVKTGEEYKNGVEVLSGIDENELIISSPEDIKEQSFAKATEDEND
ncbi:MULTISPECIES: efflux RND transporter periplasmic adaptor subunit [unclassified Ruminococcus]|uniref:efflux RND transporter periplasmic adaptor subunit n=1 Tax=unclassified Ruminococcus TaxID=2608920 RepID=UPI00210EAAFD|nr:HlyD family efflux transporter periplasmic adaptor subunit [Ruminococcus sp. zg-924]MCQ4114372.1 HlyD family efflux transporter periplasmic adaptor subunit [Ruminococcus sp. zg-921]